MSAATNTHTFKNIDLDNTQFMGVFYQGPSDEERAAYSHFEVELGENLSLAGLHWDDVTFHTNGGCAACGSHFYHGAVIVHDGTPIAIGGICSEKFGVAKIIGKAKLQAKNQARRAAARKENQQSATTQLLDNPGLSDALTTDHPIVQDISEKLWRYGSLSDAQIDLVFKIQKQEADREARREADALLLADAPALTTERQEITGTVISVRARDGYAYGTTEYKMTVKLDNGNKVWGTIPNSIFDEVWDNDNTRVTFSATIVVSDDDEHFGFFKRPTKATAQVRKEVA